MKLRGSRALCWGLAVPVVLFIAGIAPMLVSTHPPEVAARDPLARAALDADRAFDYLVKVCDIGTRISGSEGMEKQQLLLTDHFTKLGAKVGLQTFDARHPTTGGPVRMSNLIVSWHPDSKERVLLCCHYDTRPLPDQDSNPNLARNGKFIGANDGASGVALYMELGHHMAALKPTYGVDFVFFDGEELVYGPNDPFFLGSEHFAKRYKSDPPEHKYVYGVLVDMIGDKNLQIFQESNSLRYAPQLTRSIWSTAKALGVNEFVAREKHEVRDDHLALNQIAKIPSCDLIDFDYPHWHTTRDVPASCSGSSLAKVGKVLLTWLQEVPRPAEKK
jgi:hypothetical protein